MKRQASYGFNKEKLIFLGSVLILSGCLYYLLTSQPAELVVGTMVSTVSQPGPIDKEKPDPRVADVRYYLNDGQFANVVTNTPVNRQRKNPFQPIDEFKPFVDLTKVAQGKLNAPGKVATGAPLAPPPPPPVQDKEEKKKDEPKAFDPNDIVAKVDFSAVLSMNGQTYGLLKTKDGSTIQVKVGDYLDEFKYTVSKIDKEAIWVTDDDNHMFVARDLSYAEGGAGGDATGDEKPKKKEKPKEKPAAAPAPQPKAPAANNNNNNQRTPRGGRGGNNNGRGGNGNGNNGNGFGGNGNVQNWLKNMGINFGN